MPAAFAGMKLRRDDGPVLLPGNVARLQVLRPLRTFGVGMNPLPWNPRFERMLSQITDEEAHPPFSHVYDGVITVDMANHELNEAA